MAVDLQGAAGSARQARAEQLTQPAVRALDRNLRGSDMYQHEL